jgi:protein gp37
MSANSKIEWTRSTWTPIRARVREDALEIARAKGYSSLVQILEARKPNGDLRTPPGKVGPHCEHRSPGCESCYSETNNARCLPANGTGLPFDRRSRDLVDLFVDENILTQPLHWRAPRRVFVCSQTDLFGEFVTDDMIDRVFAVMALCPQHTFQVLTKRADRMREYLNHPDRKDCLALAAAEITAHKGVLLKPAGWPWPFPNVHAGVSAEDQQRADERIPVLLQTPAVVHWCSYEPALGPIDFGRYLPGLDWIVGGAESGPGARPMDEQWMRSVKDQCVAAGVAFFYKQNAIKGRAIPTPQLDGRRWTAYPNIGELKR